MKKMLFRGHLFGDRRRLIGQGRRPAPGRAARSRFVSPSLLGQRRIRIHGILDCETRIVVDSHLSKGQRHFLLHFGPRLRLLLEHLAGEQRRLRHGRVRRDPLGSDHVVDGEALLRVRLQHPADQILGLFGHLGPLGLGEFILTRPYSLLHARRDGQTVVTVEGRKSAQQNVHDDAERPNIARLVVLFGPENFRRDVIRCITRRLKRIATQGLLGEAEVRELEDAGSALCAVQKVLWLEIAMRDVHIVQELDGDTNVFHQLGGLCKEK